MFSYFPPILSLVIFGLCATQGIQGIARPPLEPKQITTTERPKGPAKYWVTYSKTLRPGHHVNFQVQIFKFQDSGRTKIRPEPVRVQVYISGKYNDTDVILLQGETQVIPGAGPKDIKIYVPLDIRRPYENSDYYWRRNYNVEVKGKGTDLEFSEKGIITLEEKAFSIFVQTDKAMYKPSQKVQFRVLAMTPDMKVVRNLKQNITVMDAKDNRILQLKGVEALPNNMGVIQKSFNLASSVPLGTWKIKVSIEGIEEEKTFEVSDYVLPRFEVKIDGSSHALDSDPIYPLTVKAMYTFGKPVTDGEVNVTVALDGYWSREPIPPIGKKGRLNKDGELKVQLTRKELISLAQRYNTYGEVLSLRERKFVITANVTEARTGKSQSGSHEVQYKMSPFKMSFLGITPTSFKSGLDFTAYLEVTNHDGTLFTSEESKHINVMINVSYTAKNPLQTTTTEKPLLLEKNETAPLMLRRRPNEDYYPTVTKQLNLDQNIYPLPDSGWIVVNFRVPDEAKSLFIVAATVSEQEDATARFDAQKSYSPSNAFLQLNVINKKIKVGDTVTVQVKATDDMNELNFQAFSKGMLLLARTVKDPNGPVRNLRFDFEATAAMLPSMSIVAFYVTDEGEFVVDALSLSVDGLFEKPVSVSFDKQKVQPGEKVNAIVKGEKDSVVFLLAVDKSVKLLKSGNDITQDLVRKELASYDYQDYGFWNYMFICGWPSYFGGSDASSVLESAGVAVLTDGLVYRHDYYDYDFHPFIEVASEGGAVTREPSPTNSIKTRKFFPESWLWSSLVISKDSDGELVIPLTVPDTITTWIASVFSVSPTTGLSVAAQPGEVTTFRNLFVSLDLPSSIVRNEEFCFPASVFSYYPSEVPVLLTLDHNPDFSNIYPKEGANGVIEMEKNQIFYSHFVGFMKENEVKTMKFCFTPEKIGTLAIQVTAITNNQELNDRVERKIPVKAEGIPRVTTFPQLVELDNGMWKETININLPKNVVEGSEMVSVNIAGNLLGPIFNNLEVLLKKPYGCGEQNMINFSPIMSLLDFFFTTNTVTDEIKDKAVDYMLIGYQKEILYEHGKSGGYSTFGNNEDTKENASMWLTAFITKCFSQAEVLDMKYGNIMAIDTAIIQRSVRWMLSQQAKDGSFVEKGRVFNKRLQGGSGKGVSLTAYTVIALIHASDVLKSTSEGIPDEVKRRTREAISYLESNMNNLDDPYDVCITAYALHLAKSKSHDVIFNKMNSLAKTGSGMTYWERPEEEKKTTYYWSRNSDAINIEMTAYALLTYSIRGVGTSQGLPIIRWLSKQKGSDGGFISTQDTVIGIEALTSVAKDLYGAEFIPMNIQVSSSGVTGINQNVQISKDNEMILQRMDIPYQAGDMIQLSAQADGNFETDQSTVLIDVVVNYNVYDKTDVESLVYGMSHEVLNLKDGFNLAVTVWTTNGKSAGMTMIKAEIPAGYIPDLEAIKKKNSVISTVEIIEDYVNIYINTDVINEKRTTIYILMDHSGGKLTKSKGKSIRVYNYYEPDVETTRTYFLKAQDFCELMPDVGICPFRDTIQAGSVIV